MKVKTKFGVGEDLGVIERDGQSFRSIQFNDGTWLIPISKLSSEQFQPTDDETTRMMSAETWNLVRRRNVAPDDTLQNRKVVLEMLR